MSTLLLPATSSPALAEPAGTVSSPINSGPPVTSASSTTATEPSSTTQPPAAQAPTAQPPAEPAAGESSAGHPPATQPPQAPQAPQTLEEVVVTERSNNLVGAADSATQGTVGAAQLRQRPILRPGELLETVPGVIISQHSGEGKANQYYLRGFNLDHGTDFATTVDGMPVNMRTHAHGQGYTDLNFLIPELVSGIEYRKGSYNADQGDFSSAGSADLSYARRLHPGPGELTLGNFSYRRLLVAGSPQNGNWVYGFEAFHNDGPWLNPDHYRKLNGVLRYSRGNDKRGFTVTGMGYDGKWNSTDQVPVRDLGRIGRFGAEDPSDGGLSHRYSLSTQMQSGDDKAINRANAYIIGYKLNLFSNFTYFLDHPETNPPGRRGDQFEQADDRRVYGFALSRAVNSTLGRRPVQNALGLQFRYDDIANVGLYDTQGRVRFVTVRQDRVKESSVAPYFENRIKWSPRFRTIAGLRWDGYGFDVASSIAANSGSSHDALLSPKLSFAFGPFQKTEYYVNLARGFHSNDARGTAITVDPTTRMAVSPVTPLVRANEAEIGVRTAAIANLQSTLSLWYLKLDSELLFTGDAGTTEPSRPSKRTGVEFSNFYTPTKYVTIDGDVAFSTARFTTFDPVGDHIPGAINSVLAAGISIDHPRGYFGSIRLRYFGPRPLIEDNSVRSAASTLVNARLGYKLRNQTRLGLDIFNVLNAKVSDIDYYYASRLPGEPGDGVNDIHTHPVESRSLRLTVTQEF